MVFRTVLQRMNTEDYNEMDDVILHVLLTTMRWMMSYYMYYYRDTCKGSNGLYPCSRAVPWSRVSNAHTLTHTLTHPSSLHYQPVSSVLIEHTLGKTHDDVTHFWQET